MTGRSGRSERARALHLRVPLFARLQEQRLHTLHGKGGLMATRRSQPYRQGPRAPGQALSAMLKGRTHSGSNPMDVKRELSILSRAKGRKRPVRPPRPKRPARPPR